MTLNELYDKMSIGTCLSGQFTVTIIYRGKEYSCKSNNTQAHDSIGCWRGDDEYCPMTEKQALQQLWNECKRKNEI